jgi:hypothetical protein
MDMTSNDFWIAVQTEFELIKADCFKMYPNEKQYGMRSVTTTLQTNARGTGVVLFELHSKGL